MNSSSHDNLNGKRDSRNGKRRTSGFSRLRKRITRVAERWFGRQEPKVKTRWRAILTGSKERNCPAAEFHKLSEELCVAGRFAEAGRICARGVELHPGNLSLAVSHAKIADAMGEAAVSLERWRRVLEIGGDKSPVGAFKNVADALLAQGDYSEAEALVRQGMASYPEDPNLEERLARISCAAGLTAQAIARWRELLEHHPGMDGAWIHRRIGEALCSEGLPDRAAAAFEEGLAKYPGNERLLKALARVNSRRVIPAAAADADFTSHLFGGKAEPFGRGICTLPFALDGRNQHVAAMLDFAECIAPFREGSRASEVDVFTTWGSSPYNSHAFAIGQAQALGKPLLSLEYGFISSLGPATSQSPHHSIVVCPDSIFFDATRPSVMEDRLNSDDYQLDETQRARATDCIGRIVSHHITKYNHAPRIDLRGRFPANGRKRVLLVDQRLGDFTVDKGMGCGYTFERMWNAALALPDHEVIVKLHPDAISGGQGSYFGCLVPDPPPPNVTLVDFEVNPFCLFEVVDEVWVCTSQLGFEALMTGLEVHCFGVPFYAGWGLTHDRVVVPRRRRQRSIVEIFHLFHIEHSRYFVPGRGLADIEDLIQFLTESETEATFPPVGKPSREPGIPDSPTPAPLRILMILPSLREGATGLYTQILARSLTRIGCEVMVLAEGKAASLEDRVAWQPLVFHGALLASSVREAVVAFSPHIVYENGVRSRSQRAALEILTFCDARLAMQSEDDDVQIYETHHGKAAAEALTLIDKPVLTLDDITRYLQVIDLKHSLNVFLDPSFDRWVEPITRALCYRLASLHTAIWKPFEKRLADEYGMPTLVVPPVASKADFERIMPDREERRAMLQRHGIDSNRVVIFIGGALYSYSDEYAVFLDALNLTVEKTAASIALVVTPNRSGLPIGRMAREKLHPDISFSDSDLSDDAAYMEMLKACDVVCSPGLPDTFNRFRLPSRLVKAMAMAKPVLTCRCGFGESLEHGVNAFLMDGSDPEQWAGAIADCMDPEKRRAVGAAGRLFAQEHFDSDHVAENLKAAFLSLMAKPARRLADGIIPTVDGKPSGIATPGKIRKACFRSRYNSTMQDALRRIAAEVIRLDTVVHLGAGNCDEFADYCRMGASRVVLVEALEERVAALRHLENRDGRIIVKHAVISGTTGNQHGFVIRNTRTDNEGREQLWLQRPSLLLERMPALRIENEPTVSTTTITEICDGIDLNAADNLLVLELNGSEGPALAATPRDLLQRFRWIALRSCEPPLCDGGTTPARIDQILRSAGFDPVATEPNHAEPAVLLLFRRASGDGNDTETDRAMSS